MEKISFKSKKFDFLKENKENEVEKNFEPNSDSIGLNQSNSKIKNNLTDCLMRFLFFSRATFFRRCLQRVVMVVILFFITPLISCIDSEGNTYYSIKVSASDFIEDKTDYSNIQKLYEQPLRVIQKAVEGEWQILEGRIHGTRKDEVATYTNTFAKITKDSVIITRGEAFGTELNFLPSSFSYKWRIKTYGNGSSYYLMVPDGDEPEEPNNWGGYTFVSIKNDILHWYTGADFTLLRVK